MVNELLAIIVIVVWCVSHSILAMQTVKEQWAKVLPLNLYRLFYNIFSIITLIILMVILRYLRLQPGLLDWTPIFTVSHFVENLFLILRIIGVIFVVGPIIQTNLFKFLGFMPEKLKDDLQIEWFYRFCRHPIYFGSIFILMPGLLITTDIIWFIRDSLFILYIVFGAIIEEYRLKRTLHGYEIMFSRGFLFPYKLSHFRILFSPKLLNKETESMVQ